MRLCERESGTARLEEAVAAYRNALKELTREGAPLQWAMTQTNLGNALTRLGERESNSGYPPASRAREPDQSRQCPHESASGGAARRV
jgi:hypothetical protein